MNVPFTRTVRALSGERSVSLMTGTFLTLTLIAAWIGWLMLARVAVYETSERARIEVGQSAYTVETTTAGRIQKSALKLDQRVQEGEILLELDATLVSQKLAEATGRFEALRPRLDSRVAEIAVEEAQKLRVNEQASAALQAARAKIEQANSSAKLANDEATRTARLQKSGAVPEIDLLRISAEAKQKDMVLEAARIEIMRIERQRDADLGEISVRISRLRSDVSDLEGQVASSRAAMAALTEERDRHVVRAPASGRIAELALKQPGSFVQPGERLATIVPNGELQAVAQFLPARSVGRVRSGQTARIRLEGYPWMQYGSLAGRVEKVGTETRDGLVRVEISVVVDPKSRIPVQHGLAGQVEVAVEQISPFELLLRASGRAVTAKASD